MQVASKYWTDYLKQYSLPHTDPTIIFTTESSSTVEAQQDFVANVELQSTYPYHFNFITNDLDARPETGFLKSNFQVLNDTEADNKLLVSTISTLKFQLLARATVGNCCSNFHQMISDFMVAGCGYAYKNDYYCMQDVGDWDLMVCCAWSPYCKEGRRDHKAKLAELAAGNVTLDNATNATLAVTTLDSNTTTTMSSL
jgi:hypothetical protein